MHPFGQALWGTILRNTVEKSQTNATSVIMHPLGQTVWGDIWKHSGEKTKKCNQCEYACSDPSSLRRHLKTHSGEKSNKCNQCDFASSRAASLRDHLKKHSFSLGTTWTHLSIYECIQYLFVYDINYTNSSRYHPDPNLFDTALTQGLFKA